jgi:signal transduction histidine kinase
VPESSRDRARSAEQIADERDRIARDLHDGAMQTLFNAGLHLEAAIDRPDEHERLLQVIDEIDTAITEIRTAIFKLHRPGRLHEGLEAAAQSMIEEAEPLLGHRPTLTIQGQPNQLSAELVREASVVMREMLTNVAKHAQSQHAWVTITVADEQLRIVVADDGVGLPPQDDRVGFGFRSLAERAEHYGGLFTIEHRAAPGAVVTWTAPLHR